MSNIEEYLKQRAENIDEVIEKYIPRKLTKDSLVFKLSKPRFSYNLEALDEAISKPIWEFLDRGGKRWRPSLFLLICEALGKNPEEFLDFAIIPEVVHNGTLLIDDIEDDSELRRGKPCSHKLFGQDVAINAGNTMYYIPLLSLVKHKRSFDPSVLSKIYEIYIQEMINLSFGQGMDIAWHKGLGNADRISETDYLQMCAYKTGTLARMAARLAAVIAGASEELVERIGHFAESLGVAFQIQDDILDVSSVRFAESKGGRGMDITEGKRTLIVIHTLQSAQPEDKERLLTILSMHPHDQKLRDEAIAIMNKYGSIDYAKRYAEELVKKSWFEINRLLPESEAKLKLEALVEFLVGREI